MRHVFVYGTLRKGEVNDIGRAAARHGLPAPRLLGAASVRGRLFDFGSYPGLVPDPAAQPVRGDVYEIDDALVPVLDEIEEVYPGVEGLFRSREVGVTIAGRELRCLFYPVAEEAVAERAPIRTGDWISYRVARDAAPELRYGS